MRGRITIYTKALLPKIVYRINIELHYLILERTPQTKLPSLTFSKIIFLSVSLVKETRM